MVSRRLPQHKTSHLHSNQKKEEGGATLSSLLLIPFIRKTKTFPEDSAKFYWPELGDMVTTKDYLRKQKSGKEE